MPSVAPVRLTYNPKVLWFDPKGIEFSKGDALIVKTERGLEYGIADEGVKEVDATAVSKLKCALKPVVRKATAEDTLAWEKAKTDAAEALSVFKQMVSDAGLEMHPVAVEFLFDGDKAIFYFEAEERVDFRELVRSLASHFHMRIDMRQIGVRDEARIVGGFGHCGQELCCKRFGGEFNPVSIRMAKDQDLSLNPQKISGVCGRLMCCLRYEADTYKEFKGRCPKMNATISTPKGDAKVVEINVPRETVTLRCGDDKRVKVPVSAMDVDAKTGRPNAVSADVFEECANRDSNTASVADSLVTPIFTGTDKLAEAPAARRTSGGSPRRSAQQKPGKGSDDAAKRSGRKRRNRPGRGADATQATQAASEKASRKGAEVASRKSCKPASSRDASRRQRSQAEQAKSDASRRPRTARPGQRSSGLAAAPTASRKPVSPARKDAGQQGAQGGEHRRSRRRSHKAQGGEARQE